jgi:hypothetical protein
MTLRNGRRTTIPLCHRRTISLAGCACSRSDSRSFSRLFPAKLLGGVIQRWLSTPNLLGGSNSEVVEPPKFTRGSNSEAVEASKITRGSNSESVEASKLLVGVIQRRSRRQKLLVGVIQKPLQLLKLLLEVIQMRLTPKEITRVSHSKWVFLLLTSPTNTGRRSKQRRASLHSG